MIKIKSFYIRNASLFFGPNQFIDYIPTFGPLHTVVASAYCSTDKNWKFCNIFIFYY